MCNKKFLFSFGVKVLMVFHSSNSCVSLSLKYSHSLLLGFFLHGMEVILVFEGVTSMSSSEALESCWLKISYFVDHQSHFGMSYSYCHKSILDFITSWDIKFELCIA